MKQNILFSEFLLVEVFAERFLLKSFCLLILSVLICFRTSANNSRFPALLSLQQNFVVKGQVKDENGENLPGVNVIVKGTTTGATTDANGNYSLTTENNNAALIFSFVGYKSQEVAINNRSQVDVTLTPDILSLGEVVVMGYNTQDRRDITGSVVTIDENELKSLPSNNFAQQLQGRAAGVTVGNDNSPGGGVSIRIRGVGSVTGNNDPLYVIDGVPTTGNLNQINQNDIETIQVLKDASAASIYGSRANNRVVIITTKKGKAGATKVSYDMYEGVQVPGNGPDMVNSQQYVDVLWADYRSRGLTNPDGTLTVADPRFGGGATGVIPDYIFSTTNVGGVMENDPIFSGTTPEALYTANYNDPQFNISKFLIYKPDKEGTDWYDVMFRSAPIRSHNLTVSGGSDQGRFAVSAGYFEQHGILINNNFKRYSLRANTEFSIKNKIRFGENLQLSFSDGVGYINPRTEFSPIIAYRTVPYQPLQDIAGNPIGHRLEEDNGYIDAIRNKDNHDYTTLIFGNLYGEADIAKNFTFRSSGGFDYKTFNRQQFISKADESDFKNRNAELTISNNYALNLTWTNTLNYQRSFDDHTLQVLVGAEAITQKYRNIEGRKNTFAFETPPYRFLDAGSQVSFLGGSGEDASLFSVFGKVDYKFRNRYLLSATLRRDASSRFSPAHRWGTFPAVSAGWLVSEESFMQSATFINSLKLRAGWGITGNQDIDPYNQYSTFVASSVTSSYPITGANSGANNLFTGVEARRNGNPDAQWEEQSMLNVAADITILNKLDFTAEWYNRVTSKLLLIAPAPATGGQNAVPARNVGEVRNRGIDLSLNYRGGNVNGFTYGIGINWSAYRNEVAKLYDATTPFIPGLSISRDQIFTRTAVGKPISSFYGMTNEGVFHSQEEADTYVTQFGDRLVFNQPGRLKYKDVNGDLVVDGTDLAFIGNPHPKFTYGINLTAAYKGFDLTLFVMGVYGNDIYNFQRESLDIMYSAGNVASKSTRILNYWRPDNADSNIPIPNSDAATQEMRTSSYFIEKGSYLRAKNLQIGYTLPAALLSKAGIDRLRIYVQGANLFTITDYEGMDPEINVQSYGTRGADTDRGVDRAPYPAAKTYLVGLQLGF